MTKDQIGRRGFLKSALATGTAATGAALIGSTIAGSEAEAKEPQAASKGKDALLPRVPRKELGTTGALVPILIQGTSQRMDQRYDRVLHRCISEGADGIDTALSYGWGSSHKAVATFLKQIGERRKVWITSKSGDESPKGFIKDADEALEELGTDYLDLYLMHGINTLDMLEPAMLKAGEKLKKMGKTRFFGFSCHGSRVVALLNRAAQVGGVDAILFRYNFRRYGDRELNRAIDAVRKAGIGLLAMKTNGAVPEDAQKVLDFKSENFNIEQAKLKFVWADERIDSVVSEMDSLQVARENINAAKSEVSLTAGEMNQLNRLAALTAHMACNGCADLCEGAAGIPQKGGSPAPRIADTLRFLMYHDAHGDPQRARRLYGELPPEARDFSGVDLAAATAACPQGIDIASRLETARKLLG